MSIRAAFLVITWAFWIASAVAGDAPANLGSSNTGATFIHGGDSASKGRDTDEVVDPNKAFQQRAFVDYQRSVSEALRTSSDPRDWALGAVMQPFWDVNELVAGIGGLTPERRESLARASYAAPDDALIQWLALSHTDKSSGSPSQSIASLSALLRLEPDNAAAWMEALNQAWGAKDEPGIDDALAHMAASPRYNDHFSELMDAWIQVYEHHPLPDDTAEPQPHAKDMMIFTLALSQATASALPRFSTLTNACRINSETAANWARSTACADIGHLMAQHATTLLSRMMGFAVLRLAGSATDEDARQARDLHWLFDQHGKLASSELEKPDAMLAYTNDWRTTGDEIQVVRRELERAGVPIFAPTQWIDPRPLISSSYCSTNQ